MKRTIIAVAFAAFLACVRANSGDEWASRVIYQILTDRFARPSTSTGNCDLSKFCGGTWGAAANHIDYFGPNGLGADALWISPIPQNSANGYHGYWASDFFTEAKEFGGASELKKLKQALTNKGIYLMADIVANHAAPISISNIKPFNKDSYYNSCNGCPSGCSIQNYQDQWQVEHCRLAGLPDLNQSVTYVRDQLIKHVKTFVGQYCNGFRVDTAPEVPKSFWRAMSTSIGKNNFAMGEVYDGRVDYVAGYFNRTNALDSVLSYPMFFTLRDVFANGQSMRNLGNRMEEYKKHFKGNRKLLGNFIDNHDQVRFLSVQSDYQKYKNAILWTLYSEGIPIIYYGSEQGFKGAADPKNREPLWTTNYNTNHELYKFIKASIAARKKAQVWKYDQVERWQDETFYAFTRGNSLCVLTNVGSNGADQTRTVTYHNYKVGTKLCNVYDANDCITVENSGMKITLKKGVPKVYVPK